MSKIQILREKILEKGLRGYIIPTFDEFLSEYPAPRFKRLEYITDFSCSNGVFIAGIESAIFFTDSRYIDAANEHFKDSGIEVFNFSELKNFDHIKYFNPQDQIGFDPRFFSKNFLNYFKNLNLVPCKDFIDDIWENRPSLNIKPIFDYDIKFAGQSREEKFQRVREFIKANGADSLVITSSESVCWLMNIRSYDSEFSPIILSYLYIDFEKIIIFTHKRNIPNFIQNVEFKDLDEFENFIKNISGKIIIPSDSSLFFSTTIKKGEIIQKDDPCLIMRSEKNAIEINGSKNAHIQDGIALIEFLSWFYENGYGKTEFELGEKITEFRKLRDQYIIDSFPPIVGFAENGAKIHYKAKKYSKTIGGNGLVLIDSGGHYYGGTTDVTRTILVGSPHIQWKEYYTRILKGHIALAKIKFPKGLTGANIDILARQYLWDIGEDYAHGTGHGVGNMLSVHEGPARISLFDSKYPIKTGMILSNEPGYYKAGEFGIRIENLQYVKESNLNQKFLEFNQLTLVPYSKDLIVIDLLTRDEIDFLKNYYQKINDSLMLNLSKAAQNYLFAETKIFS